MPGSKRHFFTINNPTLGNCCALERLFLTRHNMSLSWGTYQWEMGSNGTYHLQGALYFDKRISSINVGKLLQGVRIGCGCSLHPIEIDDDSGDETAPTIEMSPEPEERPMPHYNGHNILDRID